jgi:hypothetical protein
MTTTRTHTAHCIEMTCSLIGDNNLDTLVERGINDRLAGLDGAKAGKLIDAELEAGIAAGTLTDPTEAAAAEWLASGTATCYYDCAE